MEFRNKIVGCSLIEIYGSNLKSICFPNGNMTAENGKKGKIHRKIIRANEVL